MIKFTKVRDVKSPTRGTLKSSWIDFYTPKDLYKLKDDLKFTPSNSLNSSLLSEDRIEDNTIRLEPGEGVCIPSWLKIKLPDGGRDTETWNYYTYELVLYNKSGIAVKQNLTVGAQVIDNDYRGEFNLHVINNGLFPTFIGWGEKLVQWICRRVELFDLKEITAEEYKKYEETERGEGGFGSTGIK